MKCKFSDKEKIEGIIHRSMVCRLGLSDKGKPYIVPLNFAYANNSLYFHSAPRGRKLDIIRENPQVCVEFDIPGAFIDHENPCKAGFSYESVILHGTARIVDEVDKKKQALSLLTQRYTGRQTSFSGKEAETVAIIEVPVEQATGKENGIEKNQ